MTLPSIRAYQTYVVSGGSGTTLGPVTIPAGAVAGDLLVCAVARRKNTSFSSQTFTFPAPWAQCSGAYIYDGSRKSFDVWSKVCGVSDPGSTFNITASDSGTGQNTDVIVMSIQNAATTGTYILGSVTDTTFSGGSPYSWTGPTFSPSWGSVDQLLLTFAIAESAVATFSGAGNGYSTLVKFSANGTSFGMPMIVDSKGQSSSPTSADSGTTQTFGFAMQISVKGAALGASSLTVLWF